MWTEILSAGQFEGKPKVPLPMVSSIVRANIALSTDSRKTSHWRKTLCVRNMPQEVRPAGERSCPQDHAPGIEALYLST